MHDSARPFSRLQSTQNPSPSGEGRSTFDVRGRGNVAGGMTMRSIAALTGLLAAIFTASLSAQSAGQPVTEAALKTLVAQPERVVVVLTDQNVYMALRAGSITSIAGTMLEIAIPSDSIAMEGSVRVLGDPPSERSTAAADVVDVLSAKWSPPIDGGGSFWQLGDGTRKPGEFLQLKTGQTQPGLKINVKAVLTWWCKEPGATCQNPKR